VVQFNTGKICIVVYTPGGPNSGQKGSILFLEYFSFLGGGCSEVAMPGGAQRPVWRVNEPKKTGARSARARTRPQPTSIIIFLILMIRAGFSTKHFTQKDDYEKI
jgi:hypothetical protein